jgi:2'-5' RNA ligase
VNTIRAFIAIDLPEVVRQELASISYDLNLKVPNKSIRWVRPENIHLTLKFLGDTKVEILNQISGGLDRVGGDNPQIDLNLNKLGCFPNPRRPRIVWVDVNGDLDSLLLLQKMIDQMLNPIGWELDKRKFHPHLTLGRVKNSLQVEGSGLPWGSQVKPVTFTVDSLKLYESVLKSSGAVYSIRHISQLGGQKGSSSNS